MFSTLLSFLNVDQEAALPELWFTLAATPKKQEFSAVRELLEAYSRTNMAFISQAPIVSPKLVTDITSITFIGNHPDDLKSGLQPFIVMDGSEDHRSAAQDLAHAYALLSEQDVGLSYSDLSNLKLPKDLWVHPVTFFELEKSLGLFSNLLCFLDGLHKAVLYTTISQN